VESSDDPHEADSPAEERPQPHANRTRKHDLGDVTPRSPLRGFASSEKVLATPPLPLPSQHSAPSVLPSAAVSVPPSVPAPSELAPIVAAANAAPAPCPRPRRHRARSSHRHLPCASRARALPCGIDPVWPYPRAPLDDRDDIVELDFADTSALSDLDAFERCRLNGRNGAKPSKKDRARQRDEIERSWDAARKEHQSQSRPRVVACARDLGEALATTGPSCRRRCTRVGSSFAFSTSATGRWVICHVQST